MRRNLDISMWILIALLAFTSIRTGAFSDPMGWLMDKLLLLPGIVLGLSMHEYAHAKVAYKLGDPTPKMQGRVTANPMAHIDPLGFAALIFVGFGWGVPVQINPANFKKRRRDELLVSVAGVAMNLVIAVVFAVGKLRICAVDGSHRCDNNKSCSYDIQSDTLSASRRIFHNIRNIQHQAY